MISFLYVVRSRFTSEQCMEMTKTFGIPTSLIMPTEIKLKYTCPQLMRTHNIILKDIYPIGICSIATHTQTCNCMHLNCDGKM